MMVLLFVALSIKSTLLLVQYLHKKPFFQNSPSKQKKSRLVEDPLSCGGLIRIHHKEVGCYVVDGTKV